MGKQILSYDPETRTTEYHYYDHSNRKTYFETVQDCEGIIEANKRKQNSHNTSMFQQKGDYYHFASVPNSVLLKWKNELGIDFNRKEDLPKIEKLLNSNEYRYLRTVDRI